ncbi:general odorant-binding protein 28a-like [Musca vetustissima]|uniref:general odorant-binding protein 28a-like n=1 Tax=Musca vetustissima TaxID=27455 RepID=UPI002AB758AB|nr:general odorant-binding protein 28a-like [Musca vetustissima]
MAKLVHIFIVAVICILGAIVAVSADLDRNQAVAVLKAKADECKKEVNAKDSDVEELATRKPASTKEGKCLRACLMKKFEVMDENGKFVADVAEKHAAKITDGSAERMKMAREIIDACANIEVSSDHCEAAETYGKCFKDQAAAHGINENYEF